MKKPRNTFNSKLEGGLRSLIILCHTAPNQLDLQRLTYYDYLMVHSGDIESAPPSLHPALPYRSGEWMIRRSVVEKGLAIMVARELISKKFTDNGIYYCASELTEPFLKHFGSDYFQELTRRAGWINLTFSPMSDEELESLMTSNIGRWGSEFKRDAIFRGVSLE